MVHANAQCIQVLRQQVPDHGFLGEEGGVSGDAHSEYLWCIDPIDGTTNFAAGYPSFGVSVAGMMPLTALLPGCPYKRLALAHNVAAWSACGTR